jgi:hypothetical protein
MEPNRNMLWLMVTITPHLVEGKPGLGSFDQRWIWLRRARGVRSALAWSRNDHRTATFRTADVSRIPQ